MSTQPTKEEKAKRYDEAVSKIMDYRNGKTKMCTDVNKTLDYLFPELKESDDEKIRKEILEYFNQFENGELRGVDITSWIAWLEKQGEQKPVEWSEEDEKIFSDIIKDLVHPWNEYIPDSIEDEIKWLKNKLKSLKDRVQPQPKQEWSGEDSVAVREIFAIVEKSNCSNRAHDRIVKFLNRCTPCTKQEWSDYDNKCLAIIIAEFSKCAGKSISKDEWMRCNDWLNSIRPKKQWKPSEEQIIDLERAINDFIPSSYKEIRLSMEGLLKQLKAL